MVASDPNPGLAGGLKVGEHSFGILRDGNTTHWRASESRTHYPTKTVHTMRLYAHRLCAQAKGLWRLLGRASAITVPVVDNIAHGLTGALIGYCGFRQRGGSESGRAALWTCIAAAEFPDIDIVM